MQVLVDIGELIRLSINHNQNQLLVGTTHFNRIEIPTTLDPLSGTCPLNTMCCFVFKREFTVKKKF